ncbi:hypothetical protein Pmani_017324 [Petrolisthes manimaculis]|uniref:Secreted protein n=1 Tax=Petrolisthes manimaculis TaxID=1843537 RepID=A0AAE1PPT3_9EUCA|nr:hypothetical protein Pmani_017324 [Petrolisthes manimaculis]
MRQCCLQWRIGFCLVVLLVRLPWCGTPTQSTRVLRSPVRPSFRRPHLQPSSDRGPRTPLVDTTSSRRINGLNRLVAHAVPQISYITSLNTYP